MGTSGIRAMCGERTTSPGNCCAAPSTMVSPTTTSAGSQAVSTRGTANGSTGQPTPCAGMGRRRGMPARHTAFTATHSVLRIPTARAMGTADARRASVQPSPVISNDCGSGAMRRMFDSAFPPTNPPAWEVVAGYCGGNTPHVWTDQEWAAQKARWRLPIFTRSTGGDPDADAAAAVRWLRAHGVPPGCCVALDYETRIDAGYLRVFDWIVGQAGYLTMVYGTRRTVVQNPRPSGGYWVAEWNGTPHLYPGSAATQWSGSGPFGGAYDPNLVADSTPLWDTKQEDPMALFDTVDEFNAAVRKALGLPADATVATHQDVVVAIHGGPGRNSLDSIAVQVGAVADKVDTAWDPAAQAALLAGQLEITGISTDPTTGIISVQFGPKVTP